MSSLKINSRQRRWLLIPQLLVAMIIAVILAVSNSQTSQAASLAPQIDNTHCANPGVLVDVYPITAHGTQIGEIDLYYNRANGGYNCAWTRTVGAAYGKADFISLTIDGCNSSEGAACHPDGHDEDIDTYHTYAGPAAVTESSGGCISVHGAIVWKHDIYEGGTNGKAAHCGK